MIFNTQYLINFTFIAISVWVIPAATKPDDIAELQSEN